MTVLICKVSNLISKYSLGQVFGHTSKLVLQLTALPEFHDWLTLFRFSEILKTCVGLVLGACVSAQ